MSTLVKNSLTHANFSYLTKVLLGSLFIAVSAQISIPFYPVPMTMQAAAIMIIGLLCSPSLTVSIVGAYILEAAIGFPVLSNFTGGLPHLLGTRGGYILGFLPLALSISFFTHLSNHLISKLLGCFLGNGILYLMGVSWLSQFIGFEKALQFGLYPFLWQIPLYITFSILSAGFLKRYLK